ncbi:MAG: alpha/beta hydrolase [Planctomycetaceae bacterium]|nr:alpha/beta hydrolase [Planctomycetaceae bacterium]
MTDVSPNTWQSQGKTFAYQGHQIFYRDETAEEAGESPEVLVCVHGFPTSSWDWHLLWRTLTRRFRVIAPDMIGFGFSDKPKKYDYSIVDQADLHEALLASLNIEHYHILAHDYGDSVAQELLARDTQRESPRIQSCIMLNGGIIPTAHRPRPIQTLLAGPLGPLAVRLLNESTFRKSFTEVFGPETPPTSSELSDYWSMITHNDGHRITHKLLGYMQERRDNATRWVPTVTQPTVPLRLINGLLDPVSGKHLIDALRILAPEMDVVELRDVGHYPQVEAPARVLEAIIEFHDRLAPPAGDRPESGQESTG